MGGELRVGRRDLGLVAVGALDRGPGVVGDEQLGGAAVEREGVHVRREEALRGLVGEGLGVGVVGGAQHGDEDRGSLDFAGHRINDGHRRPRIVDE